MFRANVKIKEGLGRWMAGLPQWLAKKRRAGQEGRPLRKGEAAAVERPEPVTEGEKALWQAMGWKGNDEF